MSDKAIQLSGLQTDEPSSTPNANPQPTNDDGLSGCDEQYSIWTRSQKRRIVLLVAFASCLSPLSSFIYYPALTAIAKDMHTTLSKVNLTITSYMIVSGVAPTLFGCMADQVGRRPVYLLTFTLYVVANIGLALQDSYPALLLLRMLQSAGGSATIGLGYGVVGDITESSERGSYMGILGCGPNVAPSLGPVLGGVLAERAGWRWIFWFLAVSGALSLVLIAILLPETARNISGNGSRLVPVLNKSLLLLWRESRRKEVNMTPVGYGTAAPEAVSHIASLRIPNPLGSVHIFLQKESVPIILINGVFYSAYCCLQASLSSLFIATYGYKELEAGLIYLPFGVGCFLASLLSRNILTQDYRRLAVRHGLPTSSAETSESQRLSFPIFHARLRSMAYVLPLSILTLLAYGWALQYHLHPSIPLILQFFTGGAMTIVFNACGTLLVDLHPTRPSTAQAALNLLRCAFAAAELAALQPLIDAVGPGWCYTVIALVTGGVAGVCVVVGRVWGEIWRRQRQRTATEAA
ncbi:uncharacterized protein Z520_07660 [Fonsecaea multimorphosa CBS 102226]|uniref:Major facilitator superfamily (MFS) profile domain-containing protein n=1 Tax=Fonsecaea multimorphosa CBS 102226 TaxID=1442371 RepID=A0A0D2K0H2_9EURO|nr:uncharacterized protein Z520_07660 [Fonsecaea multimorphosa CBS 102226]KIX96394.1 hypothetical protein Z520_07660 [Fonsecaea multimorphosa CBS 102226]OAL22306.1 hypothetical protein AYO22_07350 [Fonsecaea multimorphosa]